MSSNTIFISYSRKDADFVAKFTQSLREAGATLWLDKQIRPGGHWDASIELALETCQDVILIMSKNSVESGNVMDEISYALEERKRVIPIKIEECDVPFRLRRIQHIDYYLNEENSMKLLLSTLDIKPPKPVDSQSIITPKSDIEIKKEPEKAFNEKKEQVKTVEKKNIEEKKEPLTNSNAPKKKSNVLLYSIGVAVIAAGAFFITQMGSEIDKEDKEDIIIDEPIAVVTDADDYAKIGESIEISDYETHLANFPNCEHSNEINLILNELRAVQNEENEYNDAIAQNSSTSILNYLMKYKKNAIFYDNALIELDRYFTKTGFVQFSASNGELYFTIFEDETGFTPEVNDLIFARTQRFIHKGPYGSPGFGNKIHSTSKDEVFKVTDVQQSGTAYWIQVSF
jgi:hypothetical protein